MTVIISVFFAHIWTDKSKLFWHSKPPYVGGCKVQFSKDKNITFNGSEAFVLLCFRLTIGNQTKQQDHVQEGHGTQTTSSIKYLVCGVTLFAISTIPQLGNSYIYMSQALYV